MSNCMIACGIFQMEWNAVKSEIISAYGEITPVLMDPALHMDLNLIEREIRGQLDLTKAGKPILLYGNMCHPDLCAIAAAHEAALPETACNCVDFFLSKENQKEIANGENVFFMIPGNFKWWFSMMASGGWDEVDIRMNFGIYDKIILLDTGVIEFTDELIFDLYDKVQVPVEVMTISLDYFKAVLREIMEQAKGIS